MEENLDEWDYTLTDEIVCPYCGETQLDSWEQTESGDMFCGTCEETFYVERIVNVKFTSKKLK